METLILRENQIEVDNDMFFENDSFFDKFKVDFFIIQLDKISGFLSMKKLILET